MSFNLNWKINFQLNWNFKFQRVIFLICFRNGAKKAKQESDEEKSEPDQGQEDKENDY